MEIRRVTAEEAGFDLSEKDSKPIPQPLPPAEIPKGFEEVRRASAKDRYEELPVALTDALIRVEPGARPQMDPMELGKFISIAAEAAVLKGEVDEKNERLEKLKVELIKIAKTHDGVRGVGFEELNENVNIEPVYRRKVENVTGFKEALGSLFGVLANERLQGTIDIPPELRTGDGVPVTGKILLDGFSVMMDYLGINKTDQELLLKDFKAGIHVPSDNWPKISKELREGRLPADTVSATAVWGVTPLARQQSPKPSKDSKSEA